MSSIQLLPGGKVLAAGAAGNTFAMARFNPDGSPDRTFDSADGTPDGRKTTSLGPRSDAFDAAVAPDGKIVLAGGAGVDMAVARYKGDRPVTPPAGPVTYQAEGANLSGPAFARTYGGYTGSGYADFLAPSGEFIEWTVDVSAGGQQRLDFRYANGSSSASTMSVSVDGRVVQGLMRFPSTGSWSAWKAATIFPTMAPGRHQVRLFSTGQSGPNVDALTVTPPAPATTLEAEAAARRGAVVARSHPGYTGGGYVDFVNNSGDYVEWTVDVGQAGSYALDFRYANGSSGRAMALTVDGQAAPGSRPAFIGTGSWSTWKTEGSSVQLSAGTHRIRLTTIGNNGPNIDSLTIRPAT